MPQNNPLIETKYDALLFAKSPEAATRAAKELIQAVLGDRRKGKSLRESLKECCRVLRPAQDPKDEARFEEEFVELVYWPGKESQAAA